MARIDLPGEGSDLERVWSLSPELGAAVGALTSKVGGKGLALSWRVREAARMRIAQINGCNICMAWRVPSLARHGVDEELYAHVEEPESGDYSEQERLAIEYAEKVRRIPVYPAADGYASEGPIAKLASNESPYPPHPDVVEAISRAAAAANRYPDPSASSRSARYPATVPGSAAR